jgi:hypothetical protein
VLLLFFADFARAQTSSANYTFVVASGFLCDPDNSAGCPAIAKSANGDNYEVSGAGTFDPQNKSVKAAGTFAHKSTNGSVLETGVWTGSALVSFVSYGIAPSALLREGKILGPSPFAPNHMAKAKSAMPTGGLAILRIALLATSGTTKTAVLEINCALGNVPNERSVEGIRLLFNGNGNDFSEEAGGRVMFLATLPASNATAKRPPGESASESAQPDSHQQ